MEKERPVIKKRRRVEKPKPFISEEKKAALYVGTAIGVTVLLLSYYIYLSF